MLLQGHAAKVQIITTCCSSILTIGALLSLILEYGVTLGSGMAGPCLATHCLVTPHSLCRASGMLHMFTMSPLTNIHSVLVAIHHNQPSRVPIHSQGCGHYHEVTSYS
ncbi:hypothetical protein E2C01_023289 [Portunus trituberculatus]|uniref:Uncharacterized protein n=1 Tax=Portunus trituberculatus TaxID=210409 RepID=A0A5B7EB76_PORTR|nr:hypothetical protein [Portunus trituberculatus]